MSRQYSWSVSRLGNVSVAVRSGTCANELAMHQAATAAETSPIRTRRTGHALLFIDLTYLE